MQEGISPYCGYHTIKLNEYVPIKKGDVFSVVMTSNAMPYVSSTLTRVHNSENVSFRYVDGHWVDQYESYNMTACMKAYTVEDDSKIINNKDISLDYSGGKYFSVKVATADGHAVVGAVVKFTINGKTTMVKSDANGIAKIKITDVPKSYTIATKYNGKTYKNKVTVKHVLKTSKVTVKKSVKSFVLKVNLKINGKLQKGKKVTFTFRGKSYKAITTKYGNAYLVVNKNVIKYLKKGKSYLFKVTYGKNTIKSTVTVR